MYQEMENHEDTFLPTISKELKDVLFPDVEPYSTMNKPAASNDDSAAGGIQPQDVEFDENRIDLDSLYALLHSPNSSVSKPSFSILPSKKERGKPYFIQEEECKLTTKRNEPIHLQLDSCKPGQQIHLTLRYSDQDYYDRPMVCNGCSHAYKGCSSNEDHNEANFCVRSRDGSVEYLMVLEGAAYHPTAVITVAKKHELVDLLVAFKCRNSCPEHKKYGGDRTLRLSLLDEQQEELCRNEWSLRVCESAKRDHNLFLSKAGPSRSDPASVPVVLSQPIVAPSTPAAQNAAHNSFPPARTANVQPPPMKRVKLEEETVIHYIEDAPSSTQQTGTGPIRFQSGPSHFTAYNNHAGSYRKNGNNTAFLMSSGRSSGAVSVPGCFEANPLLPIAPPATAVAEAPVAAGVIPVMIYPKNEADKKLLLTLAERLGMDVFNVLS